jgi:CspA family cold shock protein
LEINDLSDIKVYLAPIFIFIKIIMNKGTVKFFNESKGFGFIKDNGSDKEYFVHVSGLSDQVRENDEVTFDLQEGKKGLNAVNVKLA